ncbi:hypothetical protein GIB67_042337 [Kingdonia uniflora]|uniref:Uncharacterized protein n=1 Tax=Kingdonia uniflora TaxID=39325 RepID=A0A7J7LEH5_9MAGN|nr:hypothetical protein GIB67_042337 [Kingdonia uniflora]
MGETKQIPHVILLPSTGIGHLIPLTELAKRLVLHQNFSITIAIPTDGPPSKATKSFLDALPKSIDYIFLDPVNIDDLPEDIKVEARVSVTMGRSLSSLRNLFENIKDLDRVVALVVDIFGVDAIEVAKEFKVPLYVLFPSNATVLSLAFALPKLDEMYSCEFKDIPEPIQLPGCIPFHGKDVMEPIQDKKDDAYKWILHQSRQIMLAEGILVNTFMAAEPGPLSALKKREPGRPPVYPIGPLIQNRSTPDEVDGTGCLEWLDSQPGRSVLFVAFGSGGTLTNDQITELAFGLELSKQRFLWVIKSPNEKAANATYHTVQSFEDPLGFLPNGFLDRTKDLGLVIPSWAPQIQVLAHGSTGGFLTHCGWNSTLEAIVHGVPLVAWPLYAEQKMNALMLVDDLKIALRPKVDENGLVGREEVVRTIKGLMDGEEGDQVRKQAGYLKDAAAIMLSEDKSSTRSLSEVSLDLPTPISVRPTYYGMTYEEVEEADDDYYQMVRFHYMVTSGQRRSDGMRLLAEDAVTAADEVADVRPRMSRRTRSQRARYAAKGRLNIKVAKLRERYFRMLPYNVVLLEWPLQQDGLDDEGRHAYYDRYFWCDVFRELLLDAALNAVWCGTILIECKSKVMDRVNCLGKEGQNSVMAEGRDRCDNKKCYHRNPDPKSFLDKTSLFDYVALEQVELKQVLRELNIPLDIGKRDTNFIEKRNQEYLELTQKFDAQTTRMKELKEEHKKEKERKAEEVKAIEEQCADFSVGEETLEKAFAKKIERLRKIVTTQEKSLSKARDFVTRIQQVEIEEVQSQCEALRILNEKLNVDLNFHREALKSVAELNVKMEAMMIERQVTVSHLSEKMERKKAELASMQEKVEDLNEAVKKKKLDIEKSSMSYKQYLGTGSHAREVDKRGHNQFLIEESLSMLGQMDEFMTVMEARNKTSREEKLVMAAHCKNLESLLNEVNGQIVELIVPDKVKLEASEVHDKEMAAVLTLFVYEFKRLEKE